MKDIRKESINFRFLASRSDFTDHDCILMVTLSHGSEGLQIAAHDSDYNLASIFHYFKESECPTLKGKPKLFFIQACQGNQVDPGITLQPSHQHASNYQKEPEFALKNGFIGCYNIIIPKDFLIAFSTIPGRGCWLLTEKKIAYIRKNVVLSVLLTPSGWNRTVGRPHRIFLVLFCFPSIFYKQDNHVTVLGFFSWRNTTNGSWFMQTLCDELNKNGKTKDILTLLTSVKQHVAIEFCEF